jgi:hypothetical protein
MITIITDNTLSIKKASVRHHMHHHHHTQWLSLKIKYLLYFICSVGKQFRVANSHCSSKKVDNSHYSKDKQFITLKWILNCNIVIYKQILYKRSTICIASTYTNFDKEIKPYLDKLSFTKCIHVVAISKYIIYITNNASFC